MRGKKRMQVQMTNRDLRNIFQIKTLRNISIVYIFTITSNPSTSFNCLNVARYKFGAVENFREKYLFFHFENSSKKIKIHLLQRIHGGTFGNESLLKKTTAERQLQRLRKRKESTSSTTAQQSRRMDASTQTIVRLTLVASPLELKTPSYKLLLIVKVQLRPYLLNYWEGKLKKCHILKVDERNYFGADLSHILRIKKLKKCHIVKVVERNYFGADLSHILRIKKLKKCHIIKVDERNYFGADLSHILRIKKRILLGQKEPYIEKKIIVNLLGQKEPYIEKNNCEFIGPKRAILFREINVKLIIEKNNKFLIINEYKNKFMNKEEENIYSENESNSSEEETDKTNTTETQVELNKNIEVEKLVEISINTKEDSDSTQRINKEKPKEKSLQNISKRKIKKINLKAINDKIVTTIGKIIIILLLNNNKIKTEFHVVDKEFPIPRDGILGHHFLLQNNAIIDKQELIQEQRIELNVIKESDL
ncbi:hypothetical protein AGLY_009512 [Aphis glycines]|uniref:Uncharacterized protein n=1 Tax=Aphis glycines TaxID=307491 RepID=A0A6G0TJU6_APHGL|nr:hypothetical protein AGLY_009512 [Aphis glycines]